MLSYNEAEVRANILKAMAHPVRLIIVDLLTEKEHSFSELKLHFEFDKSTVSKHLSVLKNAGIVSSRKNGLDMIYKLEVACVNGFFQCATAVIEHNIKRLSCCTQ